MKKIFKIFTILVAVSFAFVSCAKSSQKAVTVEIWHTYNGSQEEGLNKIADAFNESQNKYFVKVMAQDYTGFADSVYNAVANKIGPSIIFNYGTTAVDYANEGLAVDIRKYIEEDKKKGDTSMQDIIDSLPPAMKTDVMGFADGGYYYLPGCTTGPVLFYNKTYFDQLGLNPPATWDELEKVSKTIYQKLNIPAFHADGLVDIIQTLIMQNNLGYIDTKNKKVTFAGDKMVEIYQWYADMCKKGYFSFNTIGRYASEDLSNGDIAMFSGSCVNDQYIQIANGELGMAPLPRAIGDTSFYTGWNRGPIFLMQSEEVNRGAYEFIKFFLKPENNAQWAMSNSALSPYGTTQQLPSYQEYLNNLPASKALPYVQANLDISGSFPNVTGSAAVRRYLEEYLNNVVDGKLSAAEAVKKLEEDCNKALNNL